MSRPWVGNLTLRKNLAIAFTAVLVGLIVVISLYQGLWSNVAPEPDTLYQVSAFNVFSVGNFEGNTSYAELEKHGDFGIGTLNGLNGEMIAFDGVFYQIPSNGPPRQISSSEETPYATVVFFNEDQTIQVLDPVDYSQLTASINSTLQDHNAIYAIKVQGFFDYARTRSVPVQTKPYPTLAEAVKNQTVFTVNGAKGTAVGFYFPSSMDGIDFSGYHLHLLTNDHLVGGHLLECSVRNATVEIDKINSYHLQIP